MDDTLGFRLGRSLVVWIWIVASPLAAEAERPHVVVILADDLGYGDVSCYNPDRGRIATPHLDRVAAEGMRFTDAHSSSGVCSPSRYTLLTGRYHWRTRLQSGIVGAHGSPLIDDDRMTLGSLLRQSGYRTACVGKWHLGWDWPIAPGEKKLFNPAKASPAEPTAEQHAAWKRVYGGTIPGGPTTRGFDSYFGTDVPNWPPFCFLENDRTVGIPDRLLPSRLVGNDLASRPGAAVEGWSLEAVLPALIDRACDTIAERAEAEEPLFLYLPLTTPHTPLAVNERWRGASGLASRVADLVMETDDAVGRVVAALEQAGVADQTLLVVTSDNGFAPYVGAKQLEERGHFPSGPLRGYKAEAWEGGHRVPFLVRWPGRVRAGSTCDELVCHADLFATLADLLGVALPPDAGEDSVSLTPLLRGEAGPVRDHVVSQSLRGLMAIRRGEWKLIFGRGGGGFGGPAADEGPAGQLYDLSADLAESANRYDDRPKIVAELSALMAAIADRGRSTPGPTQPNDVPIRWRRFLEPAE